MTHEPPIGHNPYPLQSGLARLGEAQERQAREFVETVVRQTRLWRRERNEVLMELFHHFDDGADAGQDVDQLIKDFGPPHIAARLIRSAKIRNRSWKWHAWHRAFQISAATVCLMLGCLLFLVARMHLATLGPPTDLVGQFDQANSSIAMTDRGWPEYREGLILFDRTLFIETRESPGLLLTGVPTDPHWDRLVKYLDGNAKSLDLFVQASQRPRLGYIYRDPSNDAWLRLAGSRTSAETYPVNVPRFWILLPQIQELNIVRMLLNSAARVALERKNGPEFLRFWRAQFGLGQQIHAESEFRCVDAYGRASILDAFALMRRIVTEHSELLSDEQLALFRSDLDLVTGETKRKTVPELRSSFEQLLQRSYTPEADYGGRLTAVGSRALCGYLTFDLSVDFPDESIRRTALRPAQEAVQLSSNWNQYESPRNVKEAVNQELIALRWSATLANRRELRLEMDRLLALLQVELDQPLTVSQDFASSAYRQELQRLVASPDQLRRYWPLFLILPGKVSHDFEQAEEIFMMAREATLTTVALEQYRRRTGKWPEHLVDLVPVDLPHVPRDVFTGRPLIYRVVAGQPLLYSVWGNHQDDGGKTLPSQVFGYGPRDGDFRYLPVD